MVERDSTETDRLLAKAQAGDQRAVSELLRSHRTYLRKLIDLRMDDEMRVRVDPSDVVQETQFVAAQRLDDFLERRPATFRIWLRRKALEQLVDLRRRHLNAAKRSVRRENTISSQSSVAIARGVLVDSPSQQLMRREVSEAVRTAVDGLRDMDREVILLRHVEELSNAEVAEVLHVDAATASQRYGRALRRLREKLVEAGVSHDR